MPSIGRFANTFRFFQPVRSFDCRKGLVAEVGVVEVGVVAALGKKVFVRAFFNDPAAGHDDDAVGVFDG